MRQRAALLRSYLFSQEFMPVSYTHLSFVEQDDVMAQLEDVLSDAFARVGVEMPTPLRRQIGRAHV